MPLEIVLVLGLGLPEIARGSDFRDDLARPQPRGIDVGDGVECDCASARRRCRRSPSDSWCRRRCPAGSSSSGRGSGRRTPAAPDSRSAPGRRRSRSPRRAPDGCGRWHWRSRRRCSRPGWRSTPGCLRIRSCMPQKQPPARIAFCSLVMRPPWWWSKQLPVLPVSLASRSSRWMNRRAAELMQYRSPPSAFGPSVNTCPRWLSPCAERTSVRIIRWEKSRFSTTCWGRSALDRPGEARPTGAAVELVDRCEQRFAGDDVDVDAGLVVVPVLAGERPLGAVLLRYVILLR